MYSVVTKDNLEAGIGYWHKKTTWPEDFHNQLYSQLFRLRQDGLNNEWWQEIVEHLWKWKAIRPKPKQFVYRRGLERLAQLDKECRLILTKNNGHDPDLATVGWEQLSTFFNVAVSIKSVASPVFASKLCHFIFPEAFVVVDTKAVGIRKGYKEHWAKCKTDWVRCEERQKLIEVLKRAISEPVTPGYPWATKITELCLIGRRVSH